MIYAIGRLDSQTFSKYRRIVTASTSTTLNPFNKLVFLLTHVYLYEDGPIDIYHMRITCARSS
jgi:hypothetical protein